MHGCALSVKASANHDHALLLLDKVKNVMSSKGHDMLHSGATSASFNHAGGTAVLPSRDVQHAWFELTRARPWRSVALVPVDDRTSTLDLGLELAQMASLDPRNRVLLVNASGVPADPLAAAGGSRSGAPPAVSPGGTAGVPGVVQASQGTYWILDCAALNMDEATVGMVEVPRQAEQVRGGTSPYTLLIVATSSLLARPAMVSSARSVDTVAVCVSLGHTSFADTKRTVELVGEENVAGTIALRPRR